MAPTTYVSPSMAPTTATTPRCINAKFAVSRAFAQSSQHGSGHDHNSVRRKSSQYGSDHGYDPQHGSDSGHDPVPHKR